MSDPQLDGAPPPRTRRLTRKGWPPAVAEDQFVHRYWEAI